MSQRSYYLFLVMITMMSAASLFATDIYLPALPDMSLHFNCSQTAIQVSVTVFLLGFAGCQLVAGMISDHFDRKKVVILGFTLYTLASLLCAYSTTLFQFYLFRVLQAIGGGVGSVISRALVADNYNKEEAAKIFSTIFPVIGLSAAIAPLVGGYITCFWGWQSTFFVIAGFGMMILLIAFYNLEHSNTKTNAQETVKNSIILGIQGYVEVICNLEFLGYVLILCASFAVFRSFAVESPFVFNAQGYIAEEIGHFYVMISVAYILGNLMAKKLIAKRNLEKVLVFGMLIFVLGGICLVGASLFYGHRPFAVLIPMTIITVGNGFLFPLSSAGAMSAVPSEITGTASGVMGAMQCVLAAFCVNLVGQVCEGEALSLSIFIGSIILIGLSSYLILVVYRPKKQATII